MKEFLAVLAVKCPVGHLQVSQAGPSLERGDQYDWVVGQVPGGRDKTAIAGYAMAMANHDTMTILLINPYIS